MKRNRDRHSGSPVVSDPGRYRKRSTVLAISCAIVASLSLIGQLSGWEVLSRQLTDFEAMNPFTAASFILICISLVTLDRQKSRRLIVPIFVGIVVSVSLIRMALLYTPIAPAIDEMFPANYPKLPVGMQLVDMAENSMIALLFCAIGVYASSYNGKLPRLAANLMALLVILLAIFSLIGYLNGVEEFKTTLANLPMAPHTAINFVLCSLSILTYNADRNLVSIVLSPYAGGRMSRFLILSAVVIPFLIGLLRLHIPGIRDLSVEFGVSFISAMTSLVLFLLIIGFSDKVNKEDQLRTEAVAKFKDLYDNSPCGYLSIDSTLYLSNINLTLLTWLGYRWEEVIGKFRYEDLLTAESKNAFLESFDGDPYKTVSIENLDDLEVEFLRKDGSSFPVLINSIAQFDSTGAFDSNKVTVFDNTARKETERKIVALNKELEGFSYSVSHDLRAPLRSITGYAEILQEDYADKLDEEGKSVIRTVSSNAKRMGQLIDDLLEFSRANRVKLSPGKLNMRHIIDTCILEEIERQNRKIQFNVHGIHDVRGDLSLIRQVWINLISNAVKYTGKQADPQVEISSTLHEQSVTYFIRDNGVGFDSRYAHKLFGVFQRLHALNDFEGTGVGLALVRRIAERHGGEVWAEGQLNNGATFFMRLPF